MKNKRRVNSIFFVPLLILVAILLFPDKVTEISNYVIKQDQQDLALIVPHFDFYKEKRDEFLKFQSKKIKPKKIILLSTDHYNNAKSNIIVADNVWSLKTGEIKPENEIKTKLINEKIATNESAAFEKDHGIKNILADISKNFQESELLSILVKSGTEKSELDNLMKEISNCSSCVIMASVDFSHNNPSSIAQSHDQFSINALFNFDYANLLKTETDSPEILYLTAKWAENKNLNFDLFYNSNVGIDQKDDSVETTSTVIGSFTNKPKEDFYAENFIISGDMMFDRLVNHSFKESGFERIFENFSNRVFWGANLSMANLEGPISDQPIDDDISVDNLTFNFPLKSVNALKFLKLNSVLLSNNHTLNDGPDGLERTRNILTQNGIQYSGEASGQSDKSTLRVDNSKISVIAINSLSKINNDEIKTLIEKEKAADRFVIIFPHWGNEYQKKHSNSQSDDAHAYIDSGADLIVGSHPHVTQDFEIYQNKPIVYSLGNFVFDQTFSRDTQEGLVLVGTVKEKELILSFVPTKHLNLKPELMRYEEKNNKIKTIIDLEGQNGFKRLNSDTISLKR